MGGLGSVSGKKCSNGGSQGDPLFSVILKKFLQLKVSNTSKCCILG